MQRLLKKAPILIGIIVLAGGVGGWQWHLRNEHGIVFTTAAVKRGDLVATITATGTIEPVEVIDVGAQVAGLIKSFGKDKNGNAIDYGSVIVEGTILATIDESVYSADLSLAKAQVEQDQALLEKAQRNLDFCTIKSPVNGVIIDRRVNIGQTVVASLNAPSLFLIAKDLTKMQIWVSVNEADVGKIVAGTPVTFTCDTFP